MVQTNWFVIAIIYGIFLLPLIALEAIVGWRILAKAGEKGWKVFIPFYNEYLLFKRVWDKNVYWFQLVFTVLYAAVAVMRRIPENEPYTVLLSILLIVTGVINVILFVFRQLHLATAFGYPTGFGIGLIFVPVVMTCILAFGRAQYIGIQPIRQRRTP